MKKIKTSVEKKHELKKAKTVVVEDSDESVETTKMFQEMKKLPFSE